MKSIRFFISVFLLFCFLNSCQKIDLTQQQQANNSILQKNTGGASFQLVSALYIPQDAE
jgi:hypothetical protein